MISAIFTGNGIVVKASEQTAWSSHYFVSIVKGALTACGYSADLVQSIICWPETASHLTSHPSISHLTFIGSQRVAYEVAQSAAKVLTPVCLELGGKDPAIVLDDAESDLARIVPVLMRGVFQAAGQNCIGLERIIAQSGIYDKLISRIEPLVKSLRVGSAMDMSPDDKPVDIGACISSANFDRLESLIKDAVRNGARLLHGGVRYAHPDHPNGHYFTPTLLVDVTPSMEIAQTELFAPIFLVMRAGTVDECVKIANGTSYALGSSVFGHNTRNLEFLVSSLHAGMVAVNDFAAYYAVQLPFGGMKGSGSGRFAGEEGLRGLCNTKAVCRDRWPWLIKTAIPGQLSLPSSTSYGRTMWEFGKGLVEVGYGESLQRRGKGIMRMLGV
jgi:acyl-CoA reductase-like NAD-dependent aldehyde dehydrogenase